jgi:WD40 repeat protein
LSTGLPIWTIHVPYLIEAGPVPSPDGKYFALADRLGVGIHDLATGRPMTHLGYFKHDPGLLALAFSPTGNLLAAGVEGGPLRLWDGKEWRQVRILDATPGRERTPFAFSRDGKTLVRKDGDGDSARLRAWDTGSWKETEVLAGPGAACRAICFSPDDKGYLLVRANDIAYVDRAGTNERTVAWDRDIAWFRTGVTACPRLFCWFHPGFEAHIQDWDTGRRLGPIRTGSPLCISLTPDGKRLVTGGGDGVIRVWDTTTARETVPDTAPSLPVTYVSPSACGDRLVTLHESGTLGGDAVRVWDLTTGRLLGHWPWRDRRTGWPTRAYFSPDGSLLAAASYRNPVSFHEALSGKQQYRPVGTKATGILLGFSADGQEIAMAEAECLRLWDVKLAVARRTIVLPRKLEGGDSVAFDPRTNLFATAANGGSAGPWADAPPDVRLCDATCSRELARLPGLGPKITALSFSADSWLVAVAYENGTIAIHDTITGSRVRCLSRCPSAIGPRVCLSFRGRFLAAGAPAYAFLRDQAVYVWSLDDKGPPRRLLPGGGGVSSLEVSADGKKLITGLWEGSVLVWDATRWTGKPSSSAPHLSGGQLERAWEAMGQVNGPAFDAVGLMLSRPQDAVPFLAPRLVAVSEPKAASLRALLRALDDSHEGVRKESRRKLAELPVDLETVLGPLAMQEYSGHPPAALKQLWDEPWYSRCPEALRRVRAVQVLDAIGGAEAQAALHRVAGGWPAAWETRWARAATGRFK